MTYSDRPGLHAGQPALTATAVLRVTRPAVRSTGRSLDTLCYGLLALLVVGQYARALDFGLIWDDPRWFQQGAGLSAWQILTSLSTYQYFRPLAILLNRALVSPLGVVNVTAAHIIQISAHLGSTLLCVSVLRSLGMAPRHARLTAVLFAMYPLSYQAVAWQSPQQPLATFCVLLALACAARAYRGRPLVWLAFSALCYAVALLFQESAVPFVGMFFWLAAVQRRAPRWPLSWWPGVHLLLAGAYTVAWLAVPRLSGVTGTGFHPAVLGYVLQALVFPSAALGMELYPALAAWPLAALVALYALLAALLMAAAARWTAPRAVLVCVAWAAAGLLPVWAGLSWDYVQIGERLLYPASLGIAGLWTAPMLWVVAQAPLWRRAAGGAVLVVVFGVAVGQLARFQQLYQLGTAHLAEATKVLSAAPGERRLFVNFPDRLALRPAPYALGYWGLILAPAGQDLSGFANAVASQSAEDSSLAVFAIGASEREQWRYQVNLRGDGASPSQVWAGARWADAIYLSEYGPLGTLALTPVGAVQPLPLNPAPLATLEGDTALLAADLEQSPGQPPRLRLLWHSAGPLALDTTVFVHFWREGSYEGDADGDSLGGLLSPAAWQPDAAVLDIRTLPSLPGPAEYEVRVGLYHRWDGQRLPAFDPNGNRLPQDEILVATLSVP